MLKSDRWIRKMSKEHDMINPFSETPRVKRPKIFGL
jgi:deoxycytidine triphosphate deaminase